MNNVNTAVKQELNLAQMEEVGGGLGWINWGAIGHAVSTVVTTVIDTEEVKKDFETIGQSINMMGQAVGHFFTIFGR